MKTYEVNELHIHLSSSNSISKSISATMYSRGTTSFSCTASVNAALLATRCSAGRSIITGRKAILIFPRASLQSWSKYFAFREYILTTPKSKCPDVRRASFTYIKKKHEHRYSVFTHINLTPRGCRMPSTVCSILVSKTWALVSFRSQCAASQTLANGPFLLSTKCA